MLVAGIRSTRSQELDEMRRIFAGREEDDLTLYRFCKGYKWDVAAGAAALDNTYTPAFFLVLFFVFLLL